MAGLAEFVTATLAYVLALAFLVAAVAKLRNLTGLDALLRQYGALPRFLNPALSKVIPCIELFLAASLCIPLSRAIAALATAVFIGAASVVIAMSLLMRRVPEHCGCFGVSRGPAPSRLTVLRGIGIAAVATVLGGTSAGSSQSVTVNVLGGAVAVCVALAWLSIDATFGARRLVDGVT
jgi:hypothetical protein